MKKNKFLRTYYRDRLRGYRLGTKAKAFLLENNPERFSFYLTGNAAVSIFRDEKPQVFAPEESSVSSLEKAAFYNSREIKELGIETVKIKGSRMMGVLLAASGIFLTYNGGPQMQKWDYRAEYRAKTLLQIILCQQRMIFQYADHTPCGLLLCNDMEPFYQLLANADSNTRCFFLLDGNYEHFYCLTNNHYGEILLKMLCSPELTDALNTILSQGLYEKDANYPIENDALDEHGNPVLFAHFLDIPRIHRFLTAINLQNRTGTLICFDFQSAVFQRLCNERVLIQTISFEKFERRFFS